jgi:hypothetical protein
MRKSKTDDELYQIAMGMFQGRLFTDRQCQNPRDVSMVFMPLAFMGEENSDYLKPRGITRGVTSLGMIYEDMSKAGPSSINGNPVFFSMQYVSPAEAAKVIEIYNRLVKATAKEVINGEATH